MIQCSENSMIQCKTCVHQKVCVYAAEYKEYLDKARELDSLKGNYPFRLSVNCTFYSQDIPVIKVGGLSGGSGGVGTRPIK